MIKIFIAIIPILLGVIDHFFEPFNSTRKGLNKIKPTSIYFILLSIIIIPLLIIDYHSDAIKETEAHNSILHITNTLESIGEKIDTLNGKEVVNVYNITAFKSFASIVIKDTPKYSIERPLAYLNKKVDSIARMKNTSQEFIMEPNKNGIGQGNDTIKFNPQVDFRYFKYRIDTCLRSKFRQPGTGVDVVINCFDNSNARQYAKDLRDYINKLYSSLNGGSYAALYNEVPALNNPAWNNKGIYFLGGTSRSGYLEFDIGNLTNPAIDTTLKPRL
jgi:hypothetical protein